MDQPRGGEMEEEEPDKETGQPASPSYWQSLDVGQQEDRN